MSDSNPRSSALSRFIEILEFGGLLSELTDEDIADSLWLAQQMGEVDSLRLVQQLEEVTVVEDKHPSSPTSDSSQSDEQNLGNIDNSTTIVDSEDKAKLIPEERGVQKSETLPIQVPQAPVLSRKLQIRRALRPLMRKFSSTSRFKLDAEATVTRIAEEEIWCAVMEPEQERWLDLELVVEASRSSFIWRQKVNEFLDILETHGAFRVIRMWSLSKEGQSLKLKPRYRQKAQASKREHHYKELKHPDRRGMILLVSDCVSPMWQQGKIHQWLKEWSKTTVTAVIQMFPEERWQATQLSLGDKAFAKAIFAGTLNEKLQLIDFPQWLLEDEDKDKTLVLPVLTMEPEMIRQWAKVQVGAAGVRIPVYRFDLPLNSTVEKDSSTERDREAEVTEEVAKERVNQFLATSLSISKRLATLMAAAPVSIDVVNLIRETLLPEAQPVHVAEVYMGGLMRVVKEDPDPNQRIYDFHPEVRAVFNQAMSLDDINAVLGANTRYIAKKIDRPIRSFKALLALLPQYDREEKQQVLPFAEVAVEVLENLGGEYAEFAQKVRSNIQRVTLPASVESSINLGEIMFNLHTRLNYWQRQPDSVQKLQGIREIIKYSIIITHVLTEVILIKDQVDSIRLLTEDAIEEINASEYIDVKNQKVMLVLDIIESRITYTSLEYFVEREDHSTINQLPYPTKDWLRNTSIYSYKLAIQLDKFNKSYEELRRLWEDKNIGIQLTVCLINLQSAMRNLLINSGKLRLNIAQILNQFISNLGQV